MGASLSCFGSGGYYQNVEEPGNEQQPQSLRKVRPSDEDGLGYVGEPDVDSKATEFIKKFHDSISLLETGADDVHATAGHQ